MMMLVAVAKGTSRGFSKHSGFVSRNDNNIKKNKSKKNSSSKKKKMASYRENGVFCLYWRDA
ncbi:hypothetical protein COLO4_21693 [Corchorus olitorius]|uniref:Uncharacterized protein n=1 Tax=Corchorus olitorius TaxID=93759 RepID=A0A1R3IRS8_9ROSI|nr:hypothetical protein COLO4_21693 [Corchorus olitorius]